MEIFECLNSEERCSLSGHMIDPNNCQNTRNLKISNIEPYQVVGETVWDPST